MRPGQQRARTASADSGACSDGFQTTGSPQTSAIAVFHDHTATGKLKALMTPTTPSGCQVSISRWPGPLGGHRAAVELPRQPDGEVADVDHLLDLAAGLGGDLADLEGDQGRQVVLVLAQQLAEPPDQAAAHRRGHRAPGPERLPGPRDGVVHLGRVRPARDASGWPLTGEVTGWSPAIASRSTPQRRRASSAWERRESSSAGESHAVRALAGGRQAAPCSRCAEPTGRAARPPRRGGRLGPAACGTGPRATPRRSPVAPAPPAGGLRAGPPAAVIDRARPSPVTASRSARVAAPAARRRGRSCAQNRSVPGDGRGCTVGGADDGRPRRRPAQDRVEAGRHRWCRKLRTRSGVRR